MEKLNLVSAKDPETQAALARLHFEMLSFYNNEMIRMYFQTAQAMNKVWDTRSPQWLLRQQVRRGMSLLDLGCGSGHAFINLRDIGPIYTGIDWSEQIINKNIVNYGQEAIFLVASIYNTGLPGSTFDLVFSLHVLEHLVWPHAFLKEMVRLVKPGGLIIVICPNYRTFGRIPSLWYGIPSPLKSKLKSRHVFDTLRHAILRTIYYPLMIKIGFPLNKYPFLINLNPSCLSGNWYVDNDAVYFVDKEEVALELCRLGTADITSELLSSSRPRWVNDESVCFVAARKR